MRQVVIAEHIGRTLRQCDKIDAGDIFDLVDILRHAGCGNVYDGMDTSDISIWNALAYGTHENMFTLTHDANNTHVELEATDEQMPYNTAMFKFTRGYAHVRDFYAMQ